MFYLSRFSFLFPHSVSVRSENTRSLPWFIAFSMAICAIMSHARKRCSVPTFRMMP
jgi:hypothetical protein